MSRLILQSQFRGITSVISCSRLWQRAAFSRSSVCQNASGKISSSYVDAGYLGDALATDGSIETVQLKFDRHSPPQEPTIYKSPLIFLHGLFGSRSNTRTVAKQLAVKLDRDVYCLDLRNFGDSPHLPRLDYPSIAADVERFIEESKFPEFAKPILVGHSLGAKASMAVALRRPELPKMIVAVDNCPVSVAGNDSSSSFGKYVNQLRLGIEKYKYTDIKDLDKLLAQVEPNITVRQFLLTNVKRGRKEDPITSKVPLDVIGKAIHAGNIASWPYDSNVVRWTKGPALFIRGTNSPYIPDEVISDIGKYFPDFEVRDVEAGHWLISENPTAFMDVLVEFIERKEDEEF
ncbi:Alpha/Beta hydrolase protein [Scheffersomyces xylosifermentans]|uniref:Alpha/Beta hydrolase protein n=1 Tax=Scheffersomyces xylosifermentans TaxID=1304137 RepID=UPI00315D0EA8